MSAGQAPRRRKEPVSEPRTPLFEVRDKVLPRPPRPIETILGDVGDLPDSGRRTARRAPPDLRTAEPELVPTIAQADQVPRTARPALIEARQSYVPRPEFDRPTRDRLPSYESYPHWEAPKALARRQPLVLLLVALVCGSVIWMLLQSPKTFISPYGGAGWSNTVGNVASKVFGVVDVPAGEHSILGQPSITVDQIEAVLTQYNSPARGSGKIWFALGKQYGIDPAYPLAFFIQESTAGTNPGWAGLKSGGDTTHNVGNIICAGYATCYKGNRDYPSWEAGIDDWYRLIAQEYVEGRGLASVEQILPIYCPISDGCHSYDYISIVNSMVEKWRHGQLFQ
jgi:hypothetical protein